MSSVALWFNRFAMFDNVCKFLVELFSANFVTCSDGSGSQMAAILIEEPIVRAKAEGRLKQDQQS